MQTYRTPHWELTLLHLNFYIYVWHVNSELPLPLKKQLFCCFWHSCALSQWLSVFPNKLYSYPVRQWAIWIHLFSPSALNYDFVLLSWNCGHILIYNLWCENLQKACAYHDCCGFSSSLCNLMGIWCCYQSYSISNLFKYITLLPETPQCCQYISLLLCQHMAVYFEDNCPCLMVMHSYHTEAISKARDEKPWAMLDRLSTWGPLGWKPAHWHTPSNFHKVYVRFM